MATILYPTRAGDGTYRNLDRAAELAREQNAELLLLYVSNVRFLDHFAAPVPVGLIEEELDELGEFLLAMAQERAEKSNIKVAAIVRHGAFRQALKDVIDEHGVAIVILGRPTHDTSNTTTEYISNAAQMLVSDLGVEVYVVDDGKFVEHYASVEET